MAYQYNNPGPRAGYGQHLQPPSGPYNNHYDGGDHYDDRQDPSRAQQRRQDGYYHSGFWQDYGAQPLDRSNQDYPPAQSQQWSGPPRGENQMPVYNGNQDRGPSQARPGQPMGPPSQMRGPRPGDPRAMPAQRQDYGMQPGPPQPFRGPPSQDNSFRGPGGPLRVVNEHDDGFDAPPGPPRSNTMPVNGAGAQPMRNRPPPLGNGPAAPQRPALIDPTSPTKLAWDNPFPMFPTKPTRSQTTPVDGPQHSRPPTAASKTSGRSTASRQSERSNHSTEATSYENSIRDPMRDLAIGGGRHDDRPGQLSRSATMPLDTGFPTNDRRPSATSQHSGKSNNFAPPNHRFDAQERSASSTGFRHQEERAELGGLQRSQTFDVNPYAFEANGPSAADPLDEYMPNFDGPAPQNETEEYMPNFDEPSRLATHDDYMPNFDGPMAAESLADSLGLGLDGAPGGYRQHSQSNSYSSQQEPKGFLDDLSFDGPRFDSPAPSNGYRDGPPMGAQQDFAPRGSSRGPANGRMPVNGSGPGPRGQPGGMRQGPPQRGPPQRDGWDGPRANMPRGPSGGGPPGAPPRGPSRERSMDNPDALPGHPVPVRMGHSQQQQKNRPAPQIQRRQPSNQRESDIPERPVSPPVTHEELNSLRAKLKSAPSDYKSHLRLAKRLVKASDTLIDTQGELDLKTRNKNREQFVVEAHKVIKKLVSKSYPDAMFYLAECYGAGKLGLQTDHKEAFSLYLSAAKLGHAGAAYRTAVSLELGGEGTRRDPQRCVQWYRRAAALGDVGAMYKLGVILLRGLLGQQANPNEGMIWLNRAAERADEDNPHAVHELALLNENPTRSSGITQDPKYALQLFQQAARLGFPKSQTRLGKAFEYGQLGCPLDDRASIHWYSKAAAQEDAEAEMALSAWYLTGSPGVLEQNDQESYLWARKAALREFAKAEFAMGHFSEVGIGCTVNLEDAKRWYGRSASHNYPKARNALDNLRKPGNAKQRKRRYSRSQPNEECTVM